MVIIIWLYNLLLFNDGKQIKFFLWFYFQLIITLIDNFKIFLLLFYINYHNYYNHSTKKWIQYTFFLALLKRSNSTPTSIMIFGYGPNCWNPRSYLTSKVLFDPNIKQSLCFILTEELFILWLFPIVSSMFFHLFFVDLSRNIHIRLWTYPWCTCAISSAKMWRWWNKLSHTVHWNFIHSLISSSICWIYSSFFTKGSPSRIYFWHRCFLSSPPLASTMPVGVVILLWWWSRFFIIFYLRILSVSIFLSLSFVLWTLNLQNVMIGSSKAFPWISFVIGNVSFIWVISSLRHELISESVGSCTFLFIYLSTNIDRTIILLDL